MNSPDDIPDVPLTGDPVGPPLQIAVDGVAEEDYTKEEAKGWFAQSLGIVPVENKARLSFLGMELAISSGAQVVGRALAWMVLVGIAIASGWAVDRLASDLTMGRLPTALLVLATGATILTAGGYYVEAKTPWKARRLHNAVWIALAGLLFLGSGLAAAYAVLTAGDDVHPHKPSITGTHYTVQPGDTLSDIADQWGDSGGYQDLVRQNPRPLPSGTSLTRDPNLIHPGDVLINENAHSR